MTEPGANSPLTLRDVARQAGVSLATVDRVLHNRPGVRSDTARRVKEAIARNSFQPHVAAAELARGRGPALRLRDAVGFMQQIQSCVGESVATSGRIGRSLQLHVWRASDILRCVPHFSRDPS